MFCGLWVENSVKACLLTYLYDFRVRLQGYSNFSKSVPTHASCAVCGAHKCTRK